MHKKIIILSILFFGLLAFHFSFAQTTQVDYKGAVVVDSDLDGLTDQGEIQIYHTDPQNPDSDGDGILDGAEIVGKTNPLDPNSPSAKEVIQIKASILEKENLWAWHLARASALIGYLSLFISIFLGLAIKTPYLKKIVSPFYSYQMHCWISLQAILFALFHGVILMFDTFIGFRLENIFVPFINSSQYLTGINANFLALGIISFYLMIILVLTSYLRRFINNKIWRALHFLNIGLFVIVFIHALFMGTDLKNGMLRWIFIGMNALLAFIFIFNLLSRILNDDGEEGQLSATSSPTPEVLENNINSNENLRQSSASFLQKRSDQNFRGRI